MSHVVCPDCAHAGARCGPGFCSRVTGRDYTPEQCRTCHARIFRTPATAPAPDWKQRLALANACMHRGHSTGRQVACDECGARHTTNPVMACALHGECTERASVKESGVRSCKGCPDKKTPEVITINQSASGIGDAISGSLAVNGFRLREEKAKTGKQVVYRVSPQSIPFVQLFDLGAVQLAPHVWDGGNLNLNRPPNAPISDIQLNTWYADETSTQGQYTRVMRNCRNLGGVSPVVPKLKDREGLTHAGREYQGVVALVPFCAWRNREWPLQRWQELERKLREHGYRVIVLDWPTPENRTAALTSEKLIGAHAEKVAGLLLNAAAVVANDTGMAHLASILGAPSCVLCGEIPGRGIWPAYGTGTRWRDSINAMHAIGVEEVLREALALAGPPRRPDGAIGETIKAHPRRVREGWYAAHCKAPLLDVGCWVDFLLPGFPCTRFDQMYGDGDATLLQGVPDSSFATVYVSHCLEHVHDPVTALRSWWRVLRPGGKLLVSVPEATLYEGQDYLPSRWNADHKHFYVAGEVPPGKPAHWRSLLADLRAALPGGEIMELRVCDEGHRWPAPGAHPLGEFSIEAVVRKTG